MPYNSFLFAFVEIKLFTRLAKEYLTDDDPREVQTALIGFPNARDVIPNSGGVRKLRWRATGRGKRGGYRVIYFTWLADGEIWLITMCPKNAADNMAAAVLKKIRNEIENG